MCFNQTYITWYGETQIMKQTQMLLYPLQSTKSPSSKYHTTHFKVPDLNHVVRRDPEYKADPNVVGQKSPHDQQLLENIHVPGSSCPRYPTPHTVHAKSRRNIHVHESICSRYPTRHTVHAKNIQKIILMKLFLVRLSSEIHNIIHAKNLGSSCPREFRNIEDAKNFG